MKRIILAIVIAFFFALALCARTSKQNLGGLVLDENNAPVEFATVAVLSLPDSTILCGGMTDENGLFDMEIPANASLIQVSLIGYNTAELTIEEFSANKTIRLTSDVKMLEGAVVQATLPKTEIKGDAVVTNIAGSVLEHSGNALDVLGKVPGMINHEGKLEVLGRGEPVCYINGRKVTDASELRNLMSEDIKSIDVVNNPGALYGGDVRCVVRIRTIKRQGEGLSYALTSQAKQHLYNCYDFEPSWSVLDLNYRVKGWDFFGKLVYWNQRNYQISDMDGGVYIESGDVLHHTVEKGRLDYRAHNAGLQFVGGANWQINENHSIGFKLDREAGYLGNNRLLMDTDVLYDDALIDHLTAISDTDLPENQQWSGNLYYDGNIDDLNINFNADFVRGGTASETNTHESSWTTPAELTSGTDAWTSLGAGKLVLTYPIGKGVFHLGSEETYVGAGQKYFITFEEIPSNDASLTENTIAGFAEYAANLPFGQLSAGIRYEHANFNYYDYSDPSKSLKRADDNWFPSFSFATMLGKVGLSISYTGKTVRPSYNMLSNEISYNNRYSYQTGDPLMRNEKHRTAALNANWNWLTFSGTYERTDNCFVQWASPYKDKGVLMVKCANLDVPFRKASFYLNASPSIGVWYPSITAGVNHQFLNLQVEDPRVPDGSRIVSLSKPMYLIQADNSFRFKNSWLLQANYYYYSKLSTGIADVYKPIQNLSFSVQKSFLKDDALTFNLSWNDVFNSSAVFAKVDYGRALIYQSNDNYNPCIEFRVSYRFNSANNKYKGTGAGQDAKNRL